MAWVFKRAHINLRVKYKNTCKWNSIKCATNIIHTQYRLCILIWHNMSNKTTYIDLSVRINKPYINPVSNSESVPKLKFGQWLENTVSLTPKRVTISCILIYFSWINNFVKVHIYSKLYYKYILQI